MQKLLIAAAASLLALSPAPATAGLRDASSASTEAEFRPWCGKRKNDSKVKFTNDRMIVDDGDGISREQFKRFNCSGEWRQLGLSGWDHWEYTCQVFYNENSQAQFGTFIFINEGAYRGFVRALKGFCGSECRPIGPSYKIE